ncbi:MAG: glutamine ABC transporter permease [Chloroflexota bacterium]|nr:MAG: glutamine ABC transporter permease [Chloroflexota bacterium]
MLDFTFMLEIIPNLLRAVRVTIEISFLAVILGTIAGIFLGSVRVLGPRLIQLLIQGMVNFIRGVPQLVIILIVYYVLPNFGLVFDEFWTGVIALTIIAAGYEVEIVRAAVESIDKGQREAALSIGMSPIMAFSQIILPQATRRMIPAITNELANTVKSSALLSVIAVNELLKIGNGIITRTFYVYEVLLEMAILYLLVVGFLIWISNYLENRVFSFGRGVGLSQEAR